MHIHVRNAAHGLSEGLRAVLHKAGPPRPSRNGPVRAMDEPLTITYANPQERVLFAPEREANPFFHLYECLWMMAGRRDVASVAAYVPGMRNYSDNGRFFNGAYGHRWRRHFGSDQIDWAVARLGSDIGPEDRRTYVSMFDPKTDQKPTLDVPCNVGIAFRVRSNGALDMTVFNRSNDLVLGAFGANVVHMSFLHEVVAQAAQLPLGSYHQVTNDMHIYLEHPTTRAVEPLVGAWMEEADEYATGEVEPFPIISSDWETWSGDLELFMAYGNVVALTDRFFRRVAGPVVAAHQYYRDNEGLRRYDGALDILEKCLAPDWRKACAEWMTRRRDKWLEKAR